MRSLRWSLSRQKLMIHAVLLVTLGSMVFVYPFDNHFRFTLGVAFLTTLLLYLTELSAFRFILVSGISIVVFRTLMAMLLGGASAGSALMENLPALAYYISFGVLFKLFDIRKMIGNFPLVLLLLSATDAASNIIELIFRPTLKSVGYEAVLASVMLIAIVRSVLSVYAYVLLKHYYSFALVQDQLKQYAEMMLLIAKLKAELFYLRKSSQDIESVMERSYWLYNQLKQSEQDEVQALSAGKALEIARDIHEVKKDYARVISGIENILKPSSPSQYMMFSEIFTIIEQNVRRYLAVSERNISISFHYEEDFLTGRHYTIVSILDNLIMNAIEACSIEGNIRVTQSRQEDNYVLAVIDNGIGLDPEEFTFLFKPGYSTKFSRETGKMSTGLGLAHVRNLTESLEGTVSVSSAQGTGTRFVITIPRYKLLAD